MINIHICDHLHPRGKFTEFIVHDYSRKCTEFTQDYLRSCSSRKTIPHENDFIN